MTNQISTLQLKDTPWPRFHHDNRSTGQSPYPSYTDGTLKWSLPLGQVRSSPAIDSDGTIYIGACSNIDYMCHIYAINPDGTQKWMTDPLVNIDVNYSSIAISSTGTLYVGDFDYVYPYLHAIDPIDGSILWSYRLDSRAYSSPAIAQDGTIYIASVAATLYAINPNGTLKWEYTNYNVSGNMHEAAGSPIIANDGTIIMLIRNGYYGVGIGFLIAITDSGNQGTLKWEYELFGSIDFNSPSIGPNDIIYVGDDAGYFYAIDINGAGIYAIQNFDNKILSAPAFSQDNSTIYIGVGPGSLGDIGSGLYALDINTGEIIWYYPTPRQERCSPAVDINGVIYIGDDNAPNATFYAINPNGTLKWSVTAVDSIRSSPAIAADGTIYFGDRDNTFYAYESLAVTNCPASPKYSGETVTLNATPKGGIGPYYVEFQKNGVLINPSRLGGTNPGTSQIYDAPENTLITRVYTLDDLDISSASLGTIDFSVYIEDSCPTGPMTCAETCTITIGCVAPVCNFVVT